MRSGGKDLGEQGKSNHVGTRSLVRKGQQKRIPQLLDMLRAVGNHAVHPSQIDLSDAPSLARRLFDLVNIITEDRNSEPRRIK